MFVFCQRGPTGEGWRQKSAARQNNSLLFQSLQTQAVRNTRNRLRVSNMLKKPHHHHHHRHRHQNHHQFGIHFIVSHRKISRMEWKYL